VGDADIMGKNKGHYNNYTSYKRTREGALMTEYISYCAPHCYAAFALTLYDKYKWDADEIAECIIAADELWDRAQKEDWDLLENCYECTDIDLRHFRETGRIMRLGRDEAMTMAQRAERVRRERMQNDL